jgi:hypothetical protein
MGGLLGIRAFRYMGSSVEGLLGIYGLFGILKPQFADWYLRYQRRYLRYQRRYLRYQRRYLRYQRQEVAWLRNNVPRRKYLVGHLKKEMAISIILMKVKMSFNYFQNPWKNGILFKIAHYKSWMRLVVTWKLSSLVACLVRERKHSLEVTEKKIFVGAKK